jgi:hypothetical protein
MSHTDEPSTPLPRWPIILGLACLLVCALTLTPMTVELVGSLSLETAERGSSGTARGQSSQSYRPHRSATSQPARSDPVDPDDPISLWRATTQPSDTEPSITNPRIPSRDELIFIGRLFLELAIGAMLLLGGLCLLIRHAMALNFLAAYVILQCGYLLMAWATTAPMREFFITSELSFVNLLLRPVKTYQTQIQLAFLGVMLLFPELVAIILALPATRRRIKAWRHENPDVQ